MGGGGRGEGKEVWNVGKEDGRTRNFIEREGRGGLIINMCDVESYRKNDVIRLKYYSDRSFCIIQTIFPRLPTTGTKKRRYLELIECTCWVRHLLNNFGGGSEYGSYNRRNELGAWLWSLITSYIGYMCFYSRFIFLFSSGFPMKMFSRIAINIFILKLVYFIRLVMHLWNESYGGDWKKKNQNEQQLAIISPSGLEVV